MTGRPIFGSGDRGHLGEAAAALVDGVLSHTARDLALSHIAHCGSCRDEVEAQRQLKARLSGLGGARLEVSSELFASMMALADTAMAIPKPVSMAIAPPAYLPHRRVRVAAAGALALAAGSGLLIAIGGTDEEPGAPVKPSLAILVDQHAATTGEVPITDPGYSAVTAGFVSR